jgi:TolA-binding protein
MIIKMAIKKDFLKFNFLILGLMLTWIPLSFSSTEKHSQHDEHKVTHNLEHEEENKQALHNKENTKENKNDEQKISLVKKIYLDFIKKIDDLRYAQEEIEKLREKIAELEKKHSEEKYHQLKELELKKVEELKSKALFEAGVEVGRTISSLNFQKLRSKPPKKVFEESYSALLKKDYETAATGFLFLVNNKENLKYHSAQTFYLAGLSLYKLQNYKQALSYFKQSVEIEKKEKNIEYTPKSLTWISLIYEKLGDIKESRRIASIVFQEFPETKEAKVLNKKSKNR